MAHAEADRNLLFGILAVQMDFVGRDALIAAMHAWVLDKTKTLGRILREQQALDAEAEALLESVVRKHLQVHGDEPARSLVALSTPAPARAILAAVPDPDPDLRSSLALLTADDAGCGSGPDSTAVGPGPAASALRFQVLRLHARGGLGEVFVAHDAELNREVALKAIRDRHADDPCCRSRFLMEAEVTGGLEHPGIVSVYGLGRHPDGRPYYAMRLIRGLSLAEAIAQFHEPGGPGQDPGRRELELRRLLRRFLDACNAVAYAHSRSVLHRDIKPANIMLGPFGETLVVDWGLAKLWDRPPAGPWAPDRPLRPQSANGLTTEIPGMAIGTPRFMSPEQAAGALDRVGPASDVYNLGATLYALLTGRDAFTDWDKASVLRQVQRGAFPPPRAVDARIPRPLEAICLKAMALRPEDRYATPEALASDLEHWLADEPVSACREPWGPRLARWARRHRPLVAGASALLVTAVAALTLGTALLAREQARTERNYRLARSAVEEMLAQVGAVDLAEIPQMEAVRARLLGRALAFYQDFLRQRGNETGLRREEARALGRLADIQEMLGRYDAAEGGYRRSLAALEELAAASPTAAEPRRLWARSLHNYGLLLKKADRLVEAEDALRAALRLREPLAATSAADAAALAETRYHLGALLARRRDRGPEDEALYRRALEDQRRLVAGCRDDPELRGQLARSLNNLGILLQATDRPDEAEATLLEAEAIQEALRSDCPATPGPRWQLARTENNLAKLRHDSGRAAEAEAPLRRSLGLLDQLQDEFPRIPDYRHELAAVCTNLGRLLQDDAPQADDALTRARALLTALVRDFPQRFDYRHQLTEVRRVQGILLYRSGRPREAERAFREGLDSARALVAACPDVPAYRGALGCTLDNLATLLLTEHRLDEARPFFTEAVGHHRITLASNDRDPQIRLFLRRDYTNLATIHREAGAHAALAAVVEELLRLAPDDRDLSILAAWHLAAAADRAAHDATLSPAEQQQRRQAYARRAVALLREAVRMGFDAVEHLEGPEYEPLRAYDRDGFERLLREMRAHSRPATG